MKLGREGERRKKQKLATDPTKTSEDTNTCMHTFLHAGRQAVIHNYYYC